MSYSKTTRSGGARESDNACAVCSRDSGDHTQEYDNSECQVKNTVYCNGQAA